MTTNRNTFLRWFTDRRFLAPRWTRGTWGERLMGTFAILADSVVDGARQAARLPLDASFDSPPDALPLLGEMRGLPRYPSENEAHYRVRLGDAWTQHQRKTAPVGLREQFQAAGYDVEIVEPFTPPEDLEENPCVWSQYGLRVHGYGTDPCTPLQWDTGHMWGGGAAWGTSLPASVCRELRDIAKRCAPTRSQLTRLRCPDPRSVLALTHWWRTDAGVSVTPAIEFSAAFSSAFATVGTLSTWTDRVSSHVLAPLSSNDVATNAIDSRVGVELTDGLQTTADLSATTHSDCTVLVTVREPDTDPATRCLFEMQNGDGSRWFRVFWSAGGDGRLYVSTYAAQNETTRVFLTSTTRALVITKSGRDLVFYVEGVRTQTVTLDDDIDVNGVFTVGTTDAGGDPLGGYLGEVAIALGVVATDEQAARLCQGSADYFGAEYLGRDFSTSLWAGRAATWRTLSWGVGVTASAPFAPTPGWAVVALPSWLTLRCATEGTTTRTGAATAGYGFAAHAPRGWSTDGSTWYLAVERWTKNYITTQDLGDPAWIQIGAASPAYIARPDGIVERAKITDTAPAAEVRAYQVLTNGAGTFTYSLWANIVSPLGAGYIQFRDGGTINIIVQASSPLDAWQYLTGTGALAAAETFVLSPRAGGVANVGAAGFAFIQAEAFSYASTFVDGVREATVLRLDPIAVAPDGYFDVATTWRVPAASLSSPFEIQFVNEDIAAFWDGAGSFTFTGSSLGSVTLAEGDVVTLRAEYLPTRVRLTLSGATAGNGSDTVAGTFDPLPRGTPVFLGNPSGASDSLFIANVTSTARNV